MIIIKPDEYNRSRADIPKGTIRLSEIVKDSTGITLHYRNYISKDDMTDDHLVETRNCLSILFPHRFVEKYQTRITMGEFMDLISKIIYE